MPACIVVLSLCVVVVSKNKLKKVPPKEETKPKGSTAPIGGTVEELMQSFRTAIRFTEDDDEEDEDANGPEWWTTHGLREHGVMMGIIDEMKWIVENTGESIESGADLRKAWITPSLSLALYSTEEFDPFIAQK